MSPYLTEAITEINAHSESGNSVNYTWTIGNETHTGATFRYFTTEGEDTGKCTASNPVSEKSASIQVECRNSTQAGGTCGVDIIGSILFWNYC